MSGRILRLLKLFVPVLVTFCLMSVASLYSQYLLDDEEYLRWVEQQNAKVPEATAFNIKAERVSGASGTKCAISIKWDLKPELTGEYVVARSDQIIDSGEKATAARVIQTVKATTSNTVLDNDCSPGSYYYAVLSTKSIMEKKIELVRDANFTSAPVVIPPPDLPFLVAKLRAVGLDNARVRLTWERYEKSGTRYNIYRSTSVIDSETKIRQAERLSAVADSGEFVDDSITVSGNYFYAVTAKTADGSEDTRLVANENYTTPGLPVVIAKRHEQVPKPEKKEKKVVSSGDVDRILKRTYFINRYDEAIDELQDLIATTDNEKDAAKARLFIGRSHIELGQYRQALNYLILADVRKYFPEDADFWEEYALTRVKNY